MAVDDAFQVRDGLTVATSGLTSSAREAVATMLDPCPRTRSAAVPDVMIELDNSVPGRLVDIQHNAGDGRVTATDGRRFYVLERGYACAVPPLRAAPPVTFALQSGFPVAPALGRLVRPMLQLAMLGRRGAAVHSAAVELDGRAVLVAGWSESGKTETALALMEAGARFLSDKWTLVGDDGTASVFPITVGVRGWALRYLPRLAGSLGVRAQARLRVAGAARVLSRPVARGPASSLLERTLTLADRVAVRPSTLRQLYGDDLRAPWSAPLGAVAVLTTVPEGSSVRADPVDPAWAAARLMLTANFERKGIFELYDRAQWSAAEPDLELRPQLMARERDLLVSILSSVPVIEVKAPFPTDPRPVAEAIAHRL
jgi:hypothetical protein